MVTSSSLATPPLWLKPLLVAYTLMDSSIQAELEHTGRQPVCAPGCHACCLQPIPASLPEVMGIRWYLNQNSHPEKRAAGEQNKKNRTTADAHPWRCPFLSNGGCTVYAVRPFACRNFLVFSLPCRPDEDPTSSRPEDVFRPPAHALLGALRKTLPIYRALGHETAPDEGRDFFTRHTALLQDIFPPDAPRG